MAKIRILYVTELYDEIDDDDQGWQRRPTPLDRYVGVDVLIDERRYTVGCCIGIPESMQGSARASGAGPTFGNGPHVWWSQDADTNGIPNGVENAVLEALRREAGRLWAEVEEMAGSRPRPAPSHDDAEEMAKP